MSKALEMLKKRKEQREKEYYKLKGMIEAYRSMDLSPTEKDMLTIFEYVTENFKVAADEIDLLSEVAINSGQRIEVLEKEVKQLKETLDTLNANR